MDRQTERCEEDHQRRELPAQREVETALVSAQHRVEGALAPLIESAVRDLAMCAQEARGHHRRQRQRHDHRYEDGHRQRHRELAEQPADDAAHQQQRDQHRDQRDADRHDGEADFTGTLEGGGERLLAFLDVARDVLQHHDGVVDNEADGDGKRHQRQIVERIVEYPHQRAGAEQRQRHRHGRNHRRPETAQEDEDHHDDQRDGEQQGELHVFHRRADGLGAVADDFDLDRRWDRSDQPRQLRLDLVDGLDDVGAGLLVHDQEHAALAIGPGRLLGVFRPGNGLADIADS